MRLTSDERESVLIIDDSPYDRSRSKWVELLSRVFDHSTGRFLKGFRMLTICWSDGTSCLPMDFALLSSSDANLEALCRILTLATDRMKQLGTFCVKTATVFFDAIMDTALRCVGLSKNKIGEPLNSTLKVELLRRS